MRGCRRGTKLNNRGSALVTVIIAMAFVGILASVLMYTSLLNYQMKANNLKAKDNFYSAESVFDEIRMGLQQEVSASVDDAYAGILEDFSKTNAEERQNQMRFFYLHELQQRLGYPDPATGAVDLNYYSLAKLYDYLIKTGAVFEGGAFSYGAVLETSSDGGNVIDCALMKRPVYGADGVTVTGYEYVDMDGGSASGAKGKMELHSDGLSLKKVRVTYTDANGYVSIIETDLRIHLPETDFAAAVSLPALSGYSILAREDILVAPGNVNSVNTIGGGFYGDNLVVGNRPAAGTEDQSTTAEVTLNLKENAATADDDKRMVAAQNLYLGKNAKLYADEYGEFWAGAITMNGGNAGRTSSVDFEGTDVYVANDLSINGKGNRFAVGRSNAGKFEGRYVGFGNGMTADASSAVLIQGTETELDFSELSNLTLAGNAYIGLEGLEGDADRPAANIKGDIVAGGSGGGSGSGGETGGDPSDGPDNPGGGGESGGGTTGGDPNRNWHSFTVLAGDKMGELDQNYPNFMKVINGSFGNDSGKYGSASYNGLIFTQYMKLNSKGVLEVRANGPATLTLLFASKEDGKDTGNEFVVEKMADGAAASSDVVKITQSAMTYRIGEAGTYQIKRKSGESHLFYVKLEEDGAQPAAASLFSESADRSIAFFSGVMPRAAADNATAPLKNLVMGQSVAVKGDQVAYLVPAECIGVDSDGTRVIGGLSNPMDKDGDYARLKELIEQDEDGSVKLIDVNVKCNALGGKSLSEYGVTEDMYQVFYKRVNSKITMVYFYIVFNNTNNAAQFTANVQNANRYFMDYYKANKANLDAYTALYTNGIQVRDESTGFYTLHLAGNMVDYSGGVGSLQQSTAAADSINLGYTAQLANYQSKYMALCTKMVDVYDLLTPDEKLAEEPYDNIVKKSAIDKYKSDVDADASFPLKTPDSEAYFFGTAENGMRLVTGDYVYDAGESIKHKKGIIIATGDITVKATAEPFTGVIISGGNITLEANASVRADKDEVLKAMSYTKQVNGYDYHVTDFFVGGEGYLNEQTETFVENDINLGDLIVYENWTKQ